MFVGGAVTDSTAKSALADHWNCSLFVNFGTQSSNLPVASVPYRHMWYAEQMVCLELWLDIIWVENSAPGGPSPLSEIHKIAYRNKRSELRKIIFVTILGIGDGLPLITKLEVVFPCANVSQKLHFHGSKCQFGLNIYATKRCLVSRNIPDF